MKKGFTLMEVLAVVVLLAMVVSFAAPAYRAVRFDMKHSQAKLAAKKLAEAVRSYYQVSRGGTIQACFRGTDVDGLAGGTCVNPAATGIPQTTAPSALNTAEQLFACGFLTVKDFKGSPYRFCTYRPEDDIATDPVGFVSPLYAVVYGTGNAVGSKYVLSKGYIYVDGTMSAKDTYQ